LDAGEAESRGVVASVGDREVAVAVAVQIAAAPPAATREVKRRALLAGETTWLALLEQEGQVLRAALLSGDDSPSA
ncbi:MAG: hypothetical protein JWM71_1748, partial [Solirubrobacteraceae bacterium]|nr:hypothetical protein [Solirubrobacteraceae bacterium]